MYCVGPLLNTYSTGNPISTAMTHGDPFEFLRFSSMPTFYPWEGGVGNGEPAL
jgi:hypothetical protein